MLQQVMADDYNSWQAAAFLPLFRGSVSDCDMQQMWDPLGPFPAR